MPVSKLEDIDWAGKRWPYAGESMYRTMKWGDMEIGYTTIPAPLDLSHGYDDGALPGGVCCCPHYGYVFEGRIRCVYPGVDWPDEVAEAGDAYFFRAGHVLIYELPTKALELNPHDPLCQLMDALKVNVEKRLARGARVGVEAPEPDDATAA